MFQDPDDQLFCPTVQEDVAFGPQQLGLSETEISARVEKSLAQVGLVGFGHRATHHLSHGEKRRVCLAGVLVCGPAILILDEPTSDLDPRGRREFKALLRQIPATKLIARHDLELAVELCARTMVLDRGEIVADGPTVKLLNDEGLMLAHGLECPHILRHIIHIEVRVGVRLLEASRGAVIFLFLWRKFDSKLDAMQINPFLKNLPVYQPGGGD